MTDPIRSGAGPARRRWIAFRPWLGLVALAALVAWAALAPLRAVEVTRSDGVAVWLPNPAAVGATSDGWDYLQLGRQVAAGRPAVSLFTYPPFVPESRESFAASGVFPLLWRPPGFPLVIGAALRLTGGHPDGMLLVQVVAIVAIPLLVLALARPLIGTLAAVAAAAWTILCPIVVGVGEPLVATASTVALVLGGVLATSRSSTRFRAFGAGLFLGTMGLVRVEAWLLMPIWLWLVAIAHPRDRRLRTLILVGSMVICAVPWSLHVADVTGRPFYNASSLLYHDTAAYPGWEASRTLAVRGESPLAFAREHPGQVLRKTVMNVARYGRDLAIWPLPALVVLAMLGGVRLWRDPRSRWLGVTAMAIPAVFVLVLSPLEYAPRFLAPAFPMIAVAAARGVAPLPRPPAVLAVITLVAIVRFGLHAASAAPARPASEAVAAIAALPVPPVGVVYSNVPTIVSCVWGVASVWAPVAQDLDTLRSILGDGTAIFAPPIDGLDASLVRDYTARAGRPPTVEPTGAITISTH